MVLKYTFGGATTGDSADLTINPVPGNPEPSADASSVGIPANSIYSLGINGIFLNQDLTSGDGMGTIEVDELRVGSTFADVTPTDISSVHEWRIIGQ